MRFTNSPLLHEDAQPFIFMIVKSRQLHLRFAVVEMSAQKYFFENGRILPTRNYPTWSITQMRKQRENCSGFCRTNDGSGCIRFRRQTMQG
jgi:hypothetical protein